MPAPIAILVGIVGVVFGMALGMFGAILQFTFLKPLGTPITEQAHRLSYASGEMIGRGFAETGRMLFGGRR